MGEVTQGEVTQGDRLEALATQRQAYEARIAELEAVLSRYQFAYHSLV